MKAMTPSANRDLEAFRLRVTGHSVPEIAASLGISESRVGNAIRRAIAGAYRWVADEQRLIELESLDELEHMLWERLRSELPVLANARGIVLDMNGEIVLDDRFLLEAMDRILKIKERRSRLMGLDAPARAEVVTIDKIDAEIRALEEKLAIRDRQQKQ
jgi:sigma-70-like protein